MNVYKVTVEFLMWDTDWAPEWVTVHVGDKVIDKTKVSTVRLVEEVTKKALVRRVRVAKDTGLKADNKGRKTNLQRINSNGELVHMYRSPRYLSACNTLSVGKYSRYKGTKCVWLNVNERSLVRKHIKATK